MDFDIHEAAIPIKKKKCSFFFKNSIVTYKNMGFFSKIIC